MRKKREISILEHEVESIELPTATPDFDRWKHRLREVIEENVDYRVAQTLEYCEYAQIFRVSVEHSGQLLPVMDRRESEDEADNACVTLTRGVTIDPREPLGPQIEHVKEVQEALDRRFRAMGEWLYKSKHDAEITCKRAGKV